MPSPVRRGRSPFWEKRSGQPEETRDRISPEVSPGGREAPGITSPSKPNTTVAPTCGNSVVLATGRRPAERRHRVFGNLRRPITEENTPVTVIATDPVSYYRPRHAAEDHSIAPAAPHRPGAPQNLRSPRHAATDTDRARSAITASAPTGIQTTGTVGLSDRDREVKLFAEEVRRAITKKRYSLRTLETMLEAYGADLRSSIGTLSAWQSGATTPPCTESGLNRVLAFERCVDVPAGDLAILVPGDLTPAVSRPLTQIGVHNRPARATLSQRHRQFQQIVNRLSGSQRTIPVATEKTYVLGWKYRPVQTVITPRLRAAHDLVDRYWFLHAPAADAHPTVVAVAGCTVGRVVHEDQVMRSATSSGDGGYKLVAVELLFDKVLTRGEPYQFTFSIGYAGTDTPRDDLFRHIQVQPCESLDLRLEFQEDKPDHIQRCRWTSHDLQLIDKHPISPDEHGKFAWPVLNPVPGAYGWTWTSRPAHSAAA